MENICKESTIGEALSDSAYLVGLISLMDVVFNKEISDVVKELNIEQSIKDAVINGTGKLGKLLRMLKDYEEDNIEEMEKHLADFGLSAERFNRIIVESFDYACNISGECN